jgi:hypothetical protein
VVDATTNSEGRPTVFLTDEQRYIFDVRGWIAVPGVLSDDEVGEMRDFCYRLRSDGASLAEKDRSSVGGPLQRLTDHPVVVGFMEEFVAHAPLASDDGYGFRVEGSFLTVRSAGNDNFRPHGGNGMLRFPGNHHTYSCLPGSANSGLTRVVWELNPVERGTGGTLFLTGSHKAAFPAPASTADIDSDLWETYECPSGSALFFTEAVRHTGAVWTNDRWDRVAVFNSYNTVGSKWHKWDADPDLVASMPPKRRSLFRPVHCQDNRVESSV